MYFFPMFGAFLRGCALADEGRRQEALAEMSRTVPALEGSVATTSFYSERQTVIVRTGARGRRAYDGDYGAERN